MDVMKEDMQMAGVTEEDARNRVRWRQMICCGEEKQLTIEKSSDAHFLMVKLCNPN